MQPFCSSASAAFCLDGAQVGAAPVGEDAPEVHPVLRNGGAVSAAASQALRTLRWVPCGKRGSGELVLMSEQAGKRRKLSEGNGKVLVLIPTNTCIQYIYTYSRYVYVDIYVYVCMYVYMHMYIYIACLCE